MPKTERDKKASEEYKNLSITKNSSLAEALNSRCCSLLTFYQFNIIDAE